MKSNADKCHLLISTNNTVKMKIGHFHIANSRNEKLLGVKFDSKLTFDDHISELCKKTCIKSNTIHEYIEKAYSYECVFQITI